MIDKIRLLVNTGARAKVWENGRGNTVTNSYIGSVDRYHFDYTLCTKSVGFEQFDTEQDAHYFGMWVNREERLTVTYSEGDLTLVDCPSAESFKAEMDDAESFYKRAEAATAGS